MPKYIFYLSGENIDLAKYEILALTNPKKIQQFDNLLIISLDKKDKLPKNLHKRLAFTHSIYIFLFVTEISKLKSKIQSFPWQDHYNKNFRITLENFPKTSIFNEKNISSLIWKKLKSPKVNLKTPKTDFTFFFVNDKVIACTHLTDTDKSYLQRKPHLRPAKHPSSTNSKLAKALVNLSGIQANETLLDPFSGVAGILIEAGLMRIKVIGYDNDPSMLEKSEKNLKFYKIKNYQLKLRDSTNLKKKFNYVVSDLPYGISTKTKNPKLTYSKFLLCLKKILNKKAVLVFPSFVDYGPLVRKAGLKIIRKFSLYIHKNLSKNIVILENK
ncbi:methyltransferase domain-containing protein [Candidatus Woesearchaeota archaeon]|nr:methyltransferase domain-containing protein [Candidatus Woesearchaeota archaeon]